MQCRIRETVLQLPDFELALPTAAAVTATNAPTTLKAYASA